MLALTIPSTGRQLRHLRARPSPRTYETALAARVTTTTGDAALSVIDAEHRRSRATWSTAAFALPSVAERAGDQRGQPDPAYAPRRVSGTPLTLLS